jgi:hypothetical protein
MADFELNIVQVVDDGFQRFQARKSPYVHFRTSHDFVVELQRPTREIPEYPTLELKAASAHSMTEPFQIPI